MYFDGDFVCLVGSTQLNIASTMPQAFLNNEDGCLIGYSALGKFLPDYTVIQFTRQPSLDSRL